MHRRSLKPTKQSSRGFDDVTKEKEEFFIPQVRNNESNYGFSIISNPGVQRAYKIWAEQHLTESLSARLKVSVLFEHYEKWVLEVYKAQPLSKRSFTRLLKAHQSKNIADGVVRIAPAGPLYVQGLLLTTETHQDQ